MFKPESSRMPRFILPRPQSTYLTMPAIEDVCLSELSGMKPTPLVASHIPNNQTKPNESKMAIPSLMSVTRCYWSAKIEADFLEEVRKRNFLWDSKHPLFSKKTLKKATYEEISDIMKEKWPHVSVLFTGDGLLKKFAKLRSYYIREAKKTKSMSGTGTPFKSKWIHYNQMSFLQDSLMLEETINRLNDSPASVTSDTDIEVDFNLEADMLNVKVETSDSAYDGSSVSSSRELERWPVEEGINLVAIEHDSSNISSSKELERLPSEKRSITSKPGFSSCKQLKRSFVSKRNNSGDTVHDEDVNSQAILLQKTKESSNSEDVYGMFIASQLREIEDPMQRDFARLEIQNIIMKYKYGTSDN